MIQLGFGKMDISIDDLTNNSQFIQLGYAPVRIDLTTDLLGLKFKEAYKNHVEGCWRPQDLLDIEWIKKYKSKKKSKK